MINQLNHLGQKKIPFFFVIDFDVKNFYIAPFEQLEHQIFFSLNGYSNITSNIQVKNVFSTPSFQLKKKPSALIAIQLHLTELSKK